MITRRDENGRMECVRQHDHAWISGALAEAWQFDGALDDEVRFAVAYHDVAWIGLDHAARLTEDGSPHSFLDHPLEQKYAACRAGIDLIETGSPYAGYLCSAHHQRLAGYLDDERSLAYVAHEVARQERLAPQLSPDQRRRAAGDTALLRLLDAVSLFACCNTPGQVTWSFHRDGFAYGDVTFQARWLDAVRIQLTPNPLAGAVACRYPAFSWDASGRLDDLVEHEVVFVG